LYLKPYLGFGVNLNAGRYLSFQTYFDYLHYHRIEHEYFVEKRTGYPDRASGAGLIYEGNYNVLRVSLGLLYNKIKIPAGMVLDVFILPDQAGKEVSVEVSPRILISLWQ
jgi:hypothetical protein